MYSCTIKSNNLFNKNFCKTILKVYHCNINENSVLIELRLISYEVTSFFRSLLSSLIVQTKKIILIVSENFFDEIHITYFGGQ
jgi:hypothetical protein